MRIIVLTARLVGDILGLQNHISPPFLKRGRGHKEINDYITDYRKHTEGQ